MKVIAIGDIHGRDSWKRIVQKNKGASEIVFLGDYFDSLIISGNQQLQNFQEILHFREQTAQKVTLLLGNHDFHYYEKSSSSYSGYGEKGIDVLKVQQLLGELISQKSITIARSIDDVLYTHAGLGMKWVDKYGITLNNPENDLNNLLLSTPQAFDIQYGYFATDDGGNDIHQGPIWIRPESLEKDSYPMKQVVGHTSQRKITFSPNGQIAYIDTLGMCGEYLAVENGKFKVRGSRKISKGKIDEMGEYFEKIGNEYHFKFREDFFYKDNKVPTSIIPVKRGDILGYIDGKSIISPIDGLLCSPYDFVDAFKTGYFFILREYSK